MNRILFQKELKQHGTWFLILGIMTWFIVMVISFGTNVEGTGAGEFTGTAMGLWIMIPICGLLISHYLITTEYQTKTQLFLQGLPLPRWRMIVIKLLLAFGLINIYAIGCILLGWLRSAGSEPVTPRFLGILLASSTGWASFVMGFFVVIGFLGRYRTVVLVAVVLALFIIGFSTSIPLGEFPPFALISVRRFGLERDAWPVHDIGMTWMFVGIWLVIAFALGMIKEGSIASMLGEKMSYREKLLLGGGVTMSFFLISNLIDTPPAKPFDVPGAIEEEWDGVRVFISPEETGKEIDLEVGIASRLARRLARERDWLQIPKEEFPKIYIIEKSDIEEVERIEWENIPNENVVLMYAGYRQKEFTENRLLSWTLSQVLQKNSLKRVSHEDRWWIVCGLEGLWELEKASEEEIENRVATAVKAVKKHGLKLENIMGWSKYQDDVEWRAADAVAWMGMKHLQETLGRETVQRLAHRTVTKRFTRVDGRAVFWDYTHPVKPAFRDVTGISLAEHVENWRKYILSRDTKENEKKEDDDA